MLGIQKILSSKMRWIFKKFVEHPNSVGENYFQHFFFAFQISFLSAQISLIALIHAIFPFLFLTEASDRLEKLQQKIKNKRKDS